MMKNILKLLFILVVFSLNATIAKISPVYFKDVTACFKEGMDMYSPTYGAIMLETGILSNLRKYGHYLPQKGERAFVKDDSPDYHFKVIKILFPSPTGTLTTETTGSSNIGKLFKGKKGIEAIAALLKVSHDLRESLTTQSEEERKETVSKNNQIKTEPKKKGNYPPKENPFFEKLIKEFFASELNQTDLKKRMQQFCSSLLEAVKIEIKKQKSLQQQKDSTKFSYPNFTQEFFPAYTIDHILLAFFVQAYDRPEDLQMLLENLTFAVNQASTQSRKSTPNELPKWTKDSFRKESSLGTSLDSLDLAFMEKNKEYIDGVTPYKAGIETISHGNSNYYSRATNTINTSATFPDCVETLMRHVFNFSFFNDETRTFDLPQSLKDGELDNFYQKTQPPAFANAGDTKMRSLWNSIVAGLEGVIYSETSKIEGDTKLSNDMQPGFLNILRAFQAITHVTWEKKYDPAQSFEERKRWVLNAFQTLLTFLSPKHTYSCDFLNATEGNITDNLPDIGGDIKVNVKDLEGNELFEFVMHVQLAMHGEIQKFKDSTFKAQEMTTNDIRFPLMQTSQDLRFLLQNESSRYNMIKLPYFYTFFSRPLSDNQARVFFLKEIEQLFPLSEVIHNNHIAYYTSFFTYALKDISWDDMNTAFLISSRLHKLKNHEEIRFILRNLVKIIWCKNSDDFTDLKLYFPDLRKLIGRESNITTINGNNFPDSLELINLTATTELTSLKFTKHMKNLQKLILNNSAIQTLEGLENCPNLEKFDVSGTRYLTSLIFTKPMEKLKEIHAYKSNLQSIYLINDAVQSQEIIQKALTNFQGKIIVITKEEDLKKAIAAEKDLSTKRALGEHLLHMVSVPSS